MRNWASDVELTPFVRDEMIINLRKALNQRFQQTHLATCQQRT